MRHNFEKHKQHRIDNAKRQADKNNKLSDSLHKQANNMQSYIPMGQPIMVGHHSEQRDRNYRKKIQNKYGKAFKVRDAAQYYSDKATTIQNNSAIYSDDPTALEQRLQKLAELQAWQQFMKDANSCIRKKDKTAFLQLPSATEQQWNELTKPDRVHGCGYPRYKLQYNNAEIKRQQRQIAFLQDQFTMPVLDITVNDIRLLTNKDANRIQLIFPGKPSEQIRQQLRKNSFKWSPTQGAWQRHLSPEAVRIATHLLNTF
ncbi:DUF3560 domain-containing protein [Paraflavitalea pollutisoli]|uniref:DUF3560 domain-containing protein n=1 Tax=Paraflavitalea pollutisoli TaxID=3034143 RepID=UPI0023EC2064|nr:DUF3560 domain-containing protein [Paraflavitalea sp. H1-2-19X]